ncbi:hypothetical protein LJB95_03150 [Paludibacteraceae bacterium OttesenSCG-928-F17]|nr:hypothetical protein [Paludibacteraceae bacterium OttesenSCG-928-F17]
MNLFWKKLFGGITSTEKYEQQQLAFQQSIKRYFEFEKSPEVEEYRKLHQTINSKEFQDKKQLLMKRKYKDTDEYKTLAKFEKLQKKKNSHATKEYEELKEKVATPEFRKANEFWKNKNRWAESPEHATEKRYLELTNNPEFADFLKQDAKEMEKYRGREVTFSDRFNEKGTNNSNWQSGFCYEKPLVGNFSHTNELQANNEGKNVAFSNGSLKLETKFGKVTARTWHPTKGFIEKQFNYTADVMQTGKVFSQKYGEFQVKLRGSGQPHHAFWLGSEKQLPYIQIAQIRGKKIIFGTIDAKGNKTSTTVTGLKPSAYYVYTLQWNSKELIWKINNMEVFRTSNNVPSNEMYLGVNSYLPENEKGGQGVVEVDWVKVFNQ